MTINKLNGTECGTEIAKKINTIIDEKASVSLDNLDATGQGIIDGKVSSSDLFDENEHIKINKLQTYSLPSGQYENLAIGASGAEYTAPVDGYFACFAIASQAYGNITLAYNDFSYGFTLISQAGGLGLRCMIPAIKGNKIKFYYEHVSSPELNFIYANGSAPQT